jgi:molybdenum cofactor biosynthesis enzyme
MVSISTKAATHRTAVAVGRVLFSNEQPLPLIQSNSLKKGDVLSVARIAGIMAAKKCPDLIPLCHPITISHVNMDLDLLSPIDEVLESKPDTDAMLIYNSIEGMGSTFGGVYITARVECTGATGVEMEALASVMGAALTVVDMCKAVDKGMRIQDVRVILKEGGRSGTWKEEK